MRSCGSEIGADAGLAAGKFHPPDEIAIITEGHKPGWNHLAARDQRHEGDAHAGLNDIRRSGQGGERSRLWV